MRPHEGSRGALATAGTRAPPSPSLRPRVCHPETRTHVALLGPCFKTGRMRPFGHQRPRRKVRPASHPTGDDRRRPLTRQWTTRPPAEQRAAQPPPEGEPASRRATGTRSSPQSPPERARRRAIRSPRERGATSHDALMGQRRLPLAGSPQKCRVVGGLGGPRRATAIFPDTTSTPPEPDGEPLQPHSLPS